MLYLWTTLNNSQIMIKKIMIEKLPEKWLFALNSA